MTWKAGASKVDITPRSPAYMMGYGNRLHKHDAVLAPIFCRGCALEDEAGTKCVQLSLELLGVSNEIVDAVRDAVAESHGVAAAAVRITATHTHSAPSLTNVYCGCAECGWVSLNKQPAAGSREQGKADIAVYTAYVTPLIIEAAQTALSSLVPAKLSHGLTSCDIAVNRRNNSEVEVAKMAEADTLDKSALNGPFDHDVELLVIRAVGSAHVIAVLFGYSCHGAHCPPLLSCHPATSTLRSC
jgi:neutral ceramidase